MQYLEPAVALEGEAIFAEGDLPTLLMFLQSGTVRLHLGALLPLHGVVCCKLPCPPACGQPAHVYAA